MLGGDGTYFTCDVKGSFYKWTGYTHLYVKVVNKLTNIL